MGTKQVRARKKAGQQQLRYRHPVSVQVESAVLSSVSKVASSPLQAAAPFAIFLISFLTFLIARHYALLRAGGGPIRWDAAWYGSIIENGYSTDGITIVQHNVAFFPLYPLLCSTVRYVFSLPTHAAMLAVSALATLLMLIVTSKLLRRYYSAPVTNLTLLLLAFNPYAVFWFNGYSEPVFFLLVAVFLLCLDKEQFGFAAVAAGLASAARPYGCLLVLVFVCELLWRHYRQYGKRITWESKYIRAFLTLPPICFAGLAAYTLWLWVRFDDPLAFAHALEGWAYAAAVGGFPLHDVVAFRHMFLLLADSVKAAGPLFPTAVGIAFFIAIPVLLAFVGRRLFFSAMVWIIVMFLFNHFLILQNHFSAADLGRHLVMMLPVSLLVALAADPRKVLSLLHHIGLGHTCRSFWQFVAAMPAVILAATFVFLSIRYATLFFSSQFVS